MNTEYKIPFNFLEILAKYTRLSHYYIGDYKIYKIICKDINISDFYIGSTKNYKGRVCTHRYDASKRNLKLYKIIRENGGWENWEMVIIEELTCSELEGKIREQRYITLLKPTMNSTNALNIKLVKKLEKLEKEAIDDAEAYSKHLLFQKERREQDSLEKEINDLETI